MAAYIATVTIPNQVWTVFTSGAVQSCRFVNLKSKVLVKGTATNVAPGNAAGAIPYDVNEGESTETSFQELFPNIGISGFLWAYCELASEISVAHA